MSSINISLERLLLILSLIIGLISCNSEEHAKEKRNKAIEKQMDKLGVTFSELSEIEHHINIVTMEQDSTAIDLSSATYVLFEEVQQARKEFIASLNMVPVEHEINTAALTPKAMNAYNMFVERIRKFETSYQSLADYARRPKKILANARLPSLINGSI